MNSRQILQKITDGFNDVEQFAGGVGAVFYLASKHNVVSETTEMLGFLPWWAIVHGLFQIVDGYVNYSEMGTKKIKPEEASLIEMALGLNLTIQGIASLAGMSNQTAPNFFPIYLSFALSTGWEFLMAFNEFERLWSRNKYADDDEISRQAIWDAGMTAFSKGLACIGWSVLAAGNPFGMYFLIASAALCLIKYIVPAVSHLLKLSWFQEPDGSNSPSSQETDLFSQDKGISITFER